MCLYTFWDIFCLCSDLGSENEFILIEGSESFVGVPLKLVKPLKSEWLSLYTIFEKYALSWTFVSDLNGWLSRAIWGIEPILSRVSFSTLRSI